MNKIFHLNYLHFCKREIPKLAYMVINWWFPICSLQGICRFVDSISCGSQGKILWLLCISSAFLCSGKFDLSLNIPEMPAPKIISTLMLFSTSEKLLLSFGDLIFIRTFFKGQKARNASTKSNDSISNSRREPKPFHISAIFWCTFSNPSCSPLPSLLHKCMKGK